MAVAIFVGGVHGRTGTTLLKRLLCAHPDVAPVVPNETRLFEHLAALTPFLDASEPFWTPQAAVDALAMFRTGVRTGFGETPAVEAALAAFEQSLGTVAMRGLQAPPQPCVPPASRSALDAGVRVLVRALLASALGDREATHVCEKTPRNAQYVGLIRRWEPDAKLVVMRRDPIDVALSHTQKNWGPADPREAALLTRQYFDRWAALRLEGDWWLEIEHSDLVEAPESTLDRVLEYVGLPKSRSVASAAAELVRSPQSRRRDHAHAVLDDMHSVLREHAAE